MGYRNNQLIARKLYELENNHRLMRESQHRRSDGVSYYEITDGVTATKSSDGMVWYIWSYREDQDDPYLKIVPRLCLPVEDIETILKAQPWVYI